MSEPYEITSAQTLLKYVRQELRKTPIISQEFKTEILEWVKDGIAFGRAEAKQEAANEKAQASASDISALLDQTVPTYSDVNDFAPGEPVETIQQKAQRILKMNDAQLRQWFNTPIKALNDRTPIQTLWAGYKDVVSSLLDQIASGVYL